MLVLLLLWSHVVGVVATVGAPQQTDSGPLSCTAAWAVLAAAWRAEPRHPAHTTAEKLGTQAVLFLWLVLASNTDTMKATMQHGHGQGQF